MPVKNYAWSVGILFLGLAAQAFASTPVQEVSGRSPPVVCQNDTPRRDASALDTTKDKTDTVSACPCVYGYVEALFLERRDCSCEQPIIVQAEDGNPAATVFSTSDLDFDFAPGVRVVVGHYLHDGWAVEGSYLGLFDADAAAFIAADSEETVLTFPGTLASGTNVFPDMDRIWINGSSALHSAELNLVCCCGCCSTCGGSEHKGCSKEDCGDCNIHCRTVEWLVGFRYLNLNEKLSIYAERDQVPTGGGSPLTEQGLYDIRTSNNLFGAQFGGRIRSWRKRLGWEATGKAGIFGNDAQQEQFVLDYPDNPESFPLRPLTSAARGQVAFVGEMNLTGIYRLNDVWNLRAGYNVLWIADVALATNQLDFRGTLPAGDRLNSCGSLFLHGVSCGVEARW